jgi:hypothetical protein
MSKAALGWTCTCTTLKLPPPEPEPEPEPEPKPEPPFGSPAILTVRPLYEKSASRSHGAASREFSNLYTQLAVVSTCLGPMSAPEHKCLPLLGVVRVLRLAI